MFGQIAAYYTNESQKQVAKCYKTQTRERGYNISRDLQNTNESGGLIIFTKGTETVFVATGENNDKTEIVIRTSFQR